jgi:hypothetical protein
MVYEYPKHLGPSRLRTQEQLQPYVWDIRVWLNCGREHLASNAG